MLDKGLPSLWGLIFTVCGMEIPSVPGCREAVSLARMLVPRKEEEGGLGKVEGSLL